MKQSQLNYYRKLDYISDHIESNIKNSQEILSEFLVSFLSVYSSSLSEDDFFYSFDNNIKKLIIDPLIEKNKKNEIIVSNENKYIFDKKELFIENNSLDQEIENLSIELVSLKKQKFSENLFHFSKIYIENFEKNTKLSFFIDKKNYLLKKIKKLTNNKEIIDLLKNEETYYLDPEFIIKHNLKIENKHNEILIIINNNEKTINNNYKKIESINEILKEIKQIKDSSLTNIDSFINTFLTKHISLNISYIFENQEKTTYEKYLNDFLFYLKFISVFSKIKFLYNNNNNSLLEDDIDKIFKIVNENKKDIFYFFELNTKI